MTRRVSFAGLLSFVLAGGCGDDGTGSGGSGGSAMGGGGSGTGGVNSGMPHTPETGCKMGYVECAGLCVDTKTDADFCGDCDTECSVDSEGTDTCEAGICVLGECNGAVCGDTCVKDRDVDADHCGSCFNRCADDALCADSECVDGDGDGASCGSPMIWDADASERAGFHFAPSLAGTHTFPCGPLEAIPTRWFRFTANDTETLVEIRSEAADDYILEVFEAASCDMESSLGCDDSGDAQGPELSAPTQDGGTYLVAVGLKNAWSGKAATIRADH